jgi:hypothetical protein
VRNGRGTLWGAAFWPDRSLVEKGTPISGVPFVVFSHDLLLTGAFRSSSVHPVAFSLLESAAWEEAADVAVVVKAASLPEAEYAAVGDPLVVESAAAAVELPAADCSAVASSSLVDSPEAEP